ncbi:MAG: TIR domain-containing protein [Smithellaceae bacterium]
MRKNGEQGKQINVEESQKKKRVSQGDVPKHSLREALTVAQAITDSFAGDPTTPHQIAMALDISPTSSAWRTLTGAAVAYGLTTGAYNSDKIALDDLGIRCTAPTEEGDDIIARGEAALKPKVFQQFFDKYNRAKFPSDPIAKNVLQQNFKVPADRTEEVLALLKDNGSFVGFIHQTKTGPFVSTDDLKPTPVTINTSENIDVPDGDISNKEKKVEQDVDIKRHVITPGAKQNTDVFKVFITHGKNKKIVDQVKDVLELYDIDYEVAIEEESPAIPVPQKVLAAMRRCQSGIMIVSADDDAAAASGIINNNVLIEIGAAFVLYDQRVVLLWDKCLKVPSNLQGLYRCEFEGNELSFAAGTKLSKAVKGFRR